MSDLNSVTIVGRLTGDPVLRVTQNNTSVASFSIANNRTYNGKEEVGFFNCVAWGKIGEIIVQHLKKGERIGISGRLNQRRWEDKEGNTNQIVEIIVNDIQFLSNKGEKQEYQENKRDQQQDQQQDQQLKIENSPFTDDNIPF